MILLCELEQQLCNPLWVYYIVGCCASNNQVIIITISYCASCYRHYLAGAAYFGRSYDHKYIQVYET